MKIYVSMKTSKYVMQSPGIAIAYYTEPYLLSDPSAGSF